MSLTATSFLFVLVTHFEGLRGGSLTLRCRAARTKRSELDRNPCALPALTRIGPFCLSRTFRRRGILRINHEGFRPGRSSASGWGRPFAVLLLCQAKAGSYAERGGGGEPRDGFLDMRHRAGGVLRA